MDLSKLLDLDQRLTLAVNGSDSIFWDNLMYVVTNTLSWSLLMFVLIMVVFKNNSVKDSVLIFITIGVMIFVADRLCSGIVKPGVARWRPTQDPQIMYLVDIVNGYRGGRFGFFSGHACNTFCVATFLAWLFRSPKVTAVLFFWCATTTFTRLYLGVHYLGDVTVGAIVGFAIGTLFYFIMRRVQMRMGTVKLISEQFTSSGYMKADMDMFLSAVFFNYICIVVFSLTLGIR